MYIWEFCVIFSVVKISSSKIYRHQYAPVQPKTLPLFIYFILFFFATTTDIFFTINLTKYFFICIYPRNEMK